MLMHMQQLKQSQKAFEQKETDKLYENLDKNSFKALLNKAFKKMLKGKSDFEKAFLAKNFKEMLTNVELYRFSKI